LTKSTLIHGLADGKGMVEVFARFAAVGKDQCGLPQGEGFSPLAEFRVPE
jgi:hypothetical protein